MNVKLAAISLVCTVALTVPWQAQGQQWAGQAQAQAEGDCKTCRHNLDTNEHWFKGNCESGSQCYDCHAFNACHSGPQAPFSCALYHWLCGSTTAMLAALDEAVAAPDAEMAIIRLANSAPTIVQVVSAGYALVKNCDGTIVAAYRVQGQLGVLVAQQTLVTTVPPKFRLFRSPA